MTESADQALIVDLTRVLREFGDRQLEMVTVVRRLREELTAAPRLVRRAGAPITFDVPAIPVAVPQHTEPLPEAFVLDNVVPEAVVPDLVLNTVVPDEAVSEVVVPDSPTITPRTKRDYDYFEELDRDLASVNDHPHLDTA
jgi:hypothetical protein